MSSNWDRSISILGWVACILGVVIITYLFLLPTRQAALQSQTFLKKHEPLLIAYRRQKQEMAGSEQLFQATIKRLEGERRIHPWPPERGTYLWAVSDVADAAEAAGLRAEVLRPRDGPTSAPTFEGVATTSLPPWQTYRLIIRSAGSQEQLDAFLDECRTRLTTARIRSLKILPAEVGSEEHPFFMELCWLIPRRPEAFRELVSRPPN